jgi:hypothetical protein
MSLNARAWLQNTSHARVLHIFDEVCNLISDEDQLLSVVSDQVGDGPFSLVLPRVHFPNHITASSTIDCDEDRLSVGDLKIDVRKTRVWDPRPDWLRLHKTILRLISGLPHLITTLEKSAPPDSLASLVAVLAMPTSTLAMILHRRLLEPADKLVVGLQRGDWALCKEGATGLAGLGDGLTPAGDDWIVGSLLGANILWWEDISRPLGEAVVEAIAGKTTPLSTAMILSASRGECSATWHDLFEALLDGDEGLIRSAAERLMTRGHTSGADALAGYVAVLRGDAIGLSWLS